MPRIDVSNVQMMGDRSAALKLTAQALKPSLVSSYSQEKVIKDKFGDDSEIGGGACLALSMHWIRAHQSSKNAPRFGETGLMSSDQVLVVARNVQLAYQRAKGRGAGKAEQTAQSEGIKQACKIFGASIIGSLDTHEFDETFEKKVSRNQQYHIIALTGFGIGHAIACYASSGKLFGRGRHFYLFDPNIGELKVPLEDAGYLIDVIRKRYLLLKHNYTGCLVAQIKP